MEVWQHTELTGTNKPCGLAIFYFTVALDLLLLGLLGTTLQTNIQLSKFFYIQLPAKSWQLTAEKIFTFRWS